MTSSACKPRRVLVVGGGLMGTACAWELARQGHEVTVLERSVPGAEASSAAAGILGAQAEAHGPGPLTRLGLLSRERYAAWSRALWDATRLDVGYRCPGILRLAFEGSGAAELQAQSAWQSDASLSWRAVDGPASRQLEPALAPELAGGIFYAADGRIDPRQLLRAVHIAAERAGVQFRSGACVKRVTSHRGRVEGVELSGEQLEASHVVVAAGSWTSLVEGSTLERDAVVPARGQIVVLHSPVPALERVVFGPDCYLVPRDDGRTLVGSTLEFVGYEKAVTAGAVARLLAAAVRLVPRLEQASVGEMWSNFRPYTPDHLPRIGPTGVDGLLLATGHYRTGILLAPITAQIIAGLVNGEPPPLDLAPFRAVGVGPAGTG